MRRLYTHQLLFYTGVTIITTLAMNLLLCSFGFIFNVKISCFVLPTSLAISLVLVWKLCRISRQEALFLSIATLGILLFTFAICDLAFDTTSDGNLYHKLAVGLLKNGWNPFTDPNSQMKLAQIPSSAPLWIIHYCKQTWYYGASVYALTNHIETAKSYTLLIIISSILITYPTVLRYTRSRSISVFLAVVSGLNPIAVSQVMTFYIDGYLHIMLWCLIVGLFLAYDDSDHNNIKCKLLLVASAMIVAGNIKFTGLVFGGAYCVLFFVLKLIKNMSGERSKRSIDEMRLWLCFFLTLAFVTVFVGGLQTYPLNVVKAGNPFYPLAGKGSVDIMTSNCPPAFANQNRIINLFESLFCVMDNSGAASEYHPLVLRIPFTIAEQDAALAGSFCDIRVGGFGPFFGCILVISLVLYAYYSINSIKEYGLGSIRVSLSLLILNVFFCLLIKESWWARYAPYIWFIPLICLSAICIQQKNTQQDLGIVNSICLICLILNSWQFAACPIHSIEQTGSIIDELENMQGKKTVQVEFGVFTGIKYNLDDYKCNYTAVEHVQDDVVAYNGMVKVG